MKTRVKSGDGAHTVRWPDGLQVVRISEVRQQMFLWITWGGVTYEVQVGPRVGKIVRAGRVQPAHPAYCPCPPGKAGAP